MNLSPCMKCVKVANPGLCEDKTCDAWRKWYIEKWNAMRVRQRLSMEHLAMEREGVNIGGEIYALPHRVKGYLETDPCEKCLCPKDLCRVPCKVKRNWNGARELVM